MRNKTTAPSKIIQEMSTKDRNFREKLDALLKLENIANDALIDHVNRIILAVKNDGDEALLRFSRKFDNIRANNVSALKLTQDVLKAAFNCLKKKEQQALEYAASRIYNYHQKQIQNTWTYTEADDTMLGQKITALECVGIYVPGGKAAYPSSVLMNAIPAKIAGVKRLIMATPAPNNNVLSPSVLAAAYVAQVDEVFTLGGAQMIAALAYGTESVPKVDKIVGPGNIYVATAKRAVFGVVGIDMIAGPSEILIICDGKTNPDWIAMDLFAQAEHDENAQSILLCPNKKFIDKIKNSIAKLLLNMQRVDIIRSALKKRGALIHTASIEEAITISNIIAPEHLELSIDNPNKYIDAIKNAGAVFIGRYTCEALGDYCAGPNHVLPTGGTARFSSPLGVYDFQKRISLIMVSKSGAKTLGKNAMILAELEGLNAHKLSIKYRQTI